MSFSMTTKVAAAAGVTAMMLGGLASPSANADPIAASPKSIFGQLSGVGSDTLQDVDNGLQMAIGRVSTDGVWKLASYDATSDSDHQVIVTNSGGANIYRPNGSGDGVSALLTAIGQKGNTTGKKTYADAVTNRAWKNDGVTGADDQVFGQIQYARSSSGPTTNASLTGAVSYVPFAKDAVDYAISASSVLPALSLGSPRDSANVVTKVAPSTLYAIYKCEATRVITKSGQATKLVNDAYTLGAGETSTDINPYIPQSSSGTAKFWALKFYDSESASLPSCVTRTYGASVSVQEHDGSALDGDAGAIMPFSIPKWIGMAKNAASIVGFGGVADVRHGAVLGTLDSVPPTMGSGSTLKLNPAFLTSPSSSTSFLVRTIYHVVPYRLVADPSTPEYAMFRGRTSLVCANSATIAAYGFGLLTATTGPNSCGDITTRAYAQVVPATNTASAALDNANSEVDFNLSAFTTTYGGTKGAKIYVVATKIDGSQTYTVNADNPVVLDAGSTAKTFSIAYSAIREGTWNLGLEVHSNLAGVSVYAPAGLVTKSVIRSATTVAATVTGRANQLGTAVVTVSSTAGTPTGTVTLRKTNSTGAIIGTGTLSGGTVTITNLTAQPKAGKVAVYVDYPGATSFNPSSKIVTWTVTK